MRGASQGYAAGKALQAPQKQLSVAALRPGAAAVPIRSSSAIAVPGSGQRGSGGDKLGQEGTVRKQGRGGDDHPQGGACHPLALGVGLWAGASLSEAPDHRVLKNQA